MENFVDYDSYMNIDKSGIDYKLPSIKKRNLSTKERQNKFVRNKQFKIKDKKILFIKSGVHTLYMPYYNIPKEVDNLSTCINKHVIDLKQLVVNIQPRFYSEETVNFNLSDKISLSCNKYDYLFVHNKDLFFYGKRVLETISGKHFCNDIFIGCYYDFKFRKNRKQFLSEKAFFKYAHKTLTPQGDKYYYAFGEETFVEEMLFEDFEKELCDKHYEADYFDFSPREEPDNYWETIIDYSYGCAYDITYHLPLGVNERKRVLEKNLTFIKESDYEDYDWL